MSQFLCRLAFALAVDFWNRALLLTAADDKLTRSRRGTSIVSLTASALNLTLIPQPRLYLGSYLCIYSFRGESARECHFSVCRLGRCRQNVTAEKV